MTLLRRAVRTVLLAAAVMAAAAAADQRQPRDFNIVIRRDAESAKCISGTLLVNDRTVCRTLELPWKENEKYISAIPAGKYKAVVRYDKPDHWRLQLVDVPGNKPGLWRTGIQIHMGNFTSQSEGCILVGTDLVPGACTVQGGTSVPAYAALKRLFYGTDEPSSSPNLDVSVTVIRAPLFDGRWISRPFKSHDGRDVPAGRWFLERADGKVRWQEMRDGRTKAWELPVELRASSVALERPNTDAGTLEFLGYTPERRQWILSQSPRPSSLTLSRDGDLLKGRWSGIVVKMREEHYQDRGKDKVRQVPQSIEYPQVDVLFEQAK